MKEQNNIPTSKVQRASRFFRAGAKVGGNYVKHYAKKFINPSLDRLELDQTNADEIFNSLGELKGSALKVAQMMSMDKNVMPAAFQERFSMAQYSAPPLSYPLVVKTFQSNLGKTPGEIFDTFTKNAVNAASIGQVHQATLNGKKLAVKIQYPGVADSISSDLNMVKPVAKRIFNISEADLNHYMDEVKDRLLEETDYALELERSQSISEACKHLDRLKFPKFYKEFSSSRILTMDWLEGLHMKDFMKTNPDQELKNAIGQAIWDFYDYQIHVLHTVHADPHPGNFLFMENGDIGVLDFGCVKVIPEKFYNQYFMLHDRSFVQDEKQLKALLYELSFLNNEDSEAEISLFYGLFKEMINLMGKPFHSDYFDFSDNAFFERIFELGERVSKMKEVRRARAARGPQHALYINRTIFGLYNLLNQLQATVNTGKTNRKAKMAS